MVRVSKEEYSRKKKDTQEGFGTYQVCHQLKGDSGVELEEDVAVSGGTNSGLAEDAAAGIVHLFMFLLVTIVFAPLMPYLALLALDKDATNGSKAARMGITGTLVIVFLIAIGLFISTGVESKNPLHVWSHLFVGFYMIWAVIVSMVSISFAKVMKFKFSNALSYGMFTSAADTTFFDPFAVFSEIEVS